MPRAAFSIAQAGHPSGVSRLLDSILVHVQELPNGTRPDLPIERNGRLCHVIAQGEATGHAHTLVADTGVGSYRSSAPELDLTTSYLVVRRGGVALEHEEHADLPVPLGLYRVVRQREYDPADGRWARVRD
jgi:hypothetical protein